MTRKLLQALVVFFFVANSATADATHADRIFGRVLVRSADTRVFIGVESQESSLKKRATVDHLFIVYLEETPAEVIDIQLDRALVNFREDRILLTSPDGPTQISFSLRRVALKPGERPEDKAHFEMVTGPQGRSVQVLKDDDAIGLAHYSEKLRPFTLEGLARTDLSTVKERGLLVNDRRESVKEFGYICYYGCLGYGGGGGTQNCPSGGPGSSSCSVSTCCSVGCSPGYYACCHCSNGCRCYRN